MAEPGRLDELKRKFDENPRRYFAPLANEYRKAGDAERAIELCRTYLPQQPTHMSGYIVYGQALYDAERTDEAAAVFGQALTLDPENIIALRYLGDIARSKDNRADAIRWYGKVLELDPRNEDITNLIAELAAPDQPRRYDGPERPVPPTIRPEPAMQGEVLALEELIALPDAPQAEIVIPMEPAPSITTIETADESVTIIRWPTDEDEGADALSNEPIEGASVESMMDFGLDEPFEGAGAASSAEAGDAGESADDGAPVPMGGSPLGGESYGADDFTGEPLAGGPFAQTSTDWDDDAPRQSASPAERAVRDRPPQEPSPLADESDWEMDQSPTSGSPFVTETMAELYVSQGMHSEALAIYHQLVARREDPRLRERIAELESSSHRGATGDEEQNPRSDAENDAADDSPRDAQSPDGAAPTMQHGGETVREFFARIGARRADAAPHIGADGESGLSRLFGAAALDAADLGAAQSLAGAFTSATPDDSARTA